MMKLDQIPRPLLVFLILLIGSLFIFFANPPLSHCDVQANVFKESLKSIIYPPSNKINSQSSLYQRSMKQCEEGNSSGSCYEFINAMRRILSSLNAVQNECLQNVIELSEVQFHIKKSIQELAILGWGEVPPDLDGGRYRWLEIGELSLYCQFKAFYFQTFGEETWLPFVKQVVVSLPGANRISQEEALLKSIFSVRCESIN